jgi:thiamine kinase-like enzyme
VLAGEWLASIQVAALKSGLAARLPNREPNHYLKLLQASRESVREHSDNPVLSANQMRMLKDLVEDCDALEGRWDEVEAICRPVPRTLVHGDFVIKNVLVRDTALGPALWGVDWEHAGWGVPAADLAQFSGRSVTPDLETYAAVWREHWPADNIDPRKLAACGKFFRLLTAMSWVSKQLTFQPYRFLATPVSTLGIYQARLHDALCSWSSRPTS